jgi:hypothetical protein
LALLGKKKKEAEEALTSAKKIIIKVKKMGMDTKDAEKMYLVAKRDLKNKRYGPALEAFIISKKMAKTTYAEGISGMLELRIKDLDEKISKMNMKNIKTGKVEKLLNEAKSSRKKKVKDIREGIKIAKEGLRIAEKRLSKFDIVSGYMAKIRSLIREFEDYNPNIETIKGYRERLNAVTELLNKGKIRSSEEMVKELNKKIKKEYKSFKAAHKSVDSVKKIISDADLLGANFQYQDELEEVQNLLLKGEFSEAQILSDKTSKDIFPILQDYKEAKHHVDSAQSKVLDVKNWGFSTYEVEKILDMAKEALKNHDFKEAKVKAEECIKKGGNIRERHKESLELIQKAKEEVEKFKINGKDPKDAENIILEAESEFNRGNYSASQEKIHEVLDQLKRQE